jgi:MFS family permease
VAKSSPRGLPLTVVLLGLTSLFTDVGSEMIFPLLGVFIVRDLHGTETFLGLIEGTADTVASLLKLVAGAASDRLKRRKALVVFGYGLASAVRPFVALASAPWHVLVVRVTDRVGKGVRTAPRDALIADAAPAGGAGRAFGFHRAMDHAGAIIGPLLATAFVSAAVPTRTIFAFAAVPGVLATASVLLVRDKTREGAGANTDGDAGEGEGGKGSRLPRSLVGYLVILLLFSLGNSSDAFLLVRAHDLGVANALLPMIWVALHVSKLVSSYVAGDLSDRVPRPRLILLGWIIYAATYLGLGVATSAWQAWAIFVVYGLYYGLTEPAEKALVKDLAPALLRGRAFGAYNFVVGVTALPAGLLTGALWRSFGARVSLTTGAAIAGVSAILLLAWNTSRFRPSRSELEASPPAAPSPP